MKILDTLPCYAEQVSYECEHELELFRKTGSGLWRSNKPTTPAIQELKGRIEAYVGVEVYDWWVMKHLPGGIEVFMHEHNDWATAIYYPEDHPAGLLTDDGVVESQAGRLVLLDPKESHGVEANDTEEVRYSVVFLYTRPEDPQGEVGATS